MDEINELELPSNGVYSKAVVEVLDGISTRSLTSKEMYSILERRFDLSDEQLNELAPDNRSLHENRTRCAVKYLKKIGVLDDNAPKGVWRLV